jgi:eukaryotic-like serine/threonine-protein kinase
MPIDPKRVQAIFLAAVEVNEVADRAALLDRECGSDHALRQRVESLLRAHDAPDSLDEPIDGPTAFHDPTPVDAGSIHVAAPRTEVVGTRIGPYKLLQQIGEGGMGVVFVAEQERPVKRRVALKVIKPGMDTTQVVARFEAERQALAMMDHPNIARVLDAGATDAGRPYFVMELVKGVPITDYCDTVHLTPKERLELFIPVCAAIQHAHQKGIIHRDIKPSNVLVTMQDGKPVPKVIDFGIAKAIDQRLTERSLFTDHGAIVGTLEYMSPEQAEMSAMDVDTRTDVYALGVLLYELLTGTTPLERARLRKSGYAEILKRIREEEPETPSSRVRSGRLSESNATTARDGASPDLSSIAAARKTEPARLTKLIRGDLDWIVMKALEKDRTRRYETANGFARDIQRHLDGDAVEACPPSAGYKLRKFLHKNRRSATAAALLFLALALGIVGTTFGLLRAEAARRRAVTAEAAAIAQARIAGRERDEKEEARREAVAIGVALAAQTEKAEAARLRTRQALDSLTDDVVTKLLSQDTKLGTKEKEFLRKAQGYFEEFAKDQGDTDQARRDRARGLFRVAKIRMRLGEFREAAEGFRIAEPLLERLTEKPHAMVEDWILLGEVRGNLAAKLTHEGKTLEAILVLRRIVSDDEKFVVTGQDGAKFLGTLATHQLNLANALRGGGMREEAERLYLKALTNLEKLPLDSQSPVDRLFLSSCYNNLGSVYGERGDFVRAEEYLARALDARIRLAADHPEDPLHQDYLARGRANLAMTLHMLHRREEAEAQFRAAIELREALVKTYLGQPRYRYELADLLNSVGNWLLESGKAKSALDRFDRAIAVAMVETTPEMTPFLKSQEKAARVGRANALDRLGRRAEVSKEWDKVLDLSTEEERPGVRLLRAGALARAGQTDEAIREAEAVDKDAAFVLLYDSACVLALVHARTKDDAHAIRAVARLREAVAKGWKDAAHMRQDADLDSLRGRDDYKQILKDLEKAAPPHRPSSNPTGSHEGSKVEQDPGSPK